MKVKTESGYGELNIIGASVSFYDDYKRGSIRIISYSGDFNYEDTFVVVASFIHAKGSAYSVKGSGGNKFVIILIEDPKETMGYITVFTQDNYEIRLYGSSDT